MDALDVLYDHYKESFSLVKEAQVRRNKSFVVLCALEAFSFLLLLRPEKAFQLIIDGINSELNASLQLSNTIIQTLLWLLITYVMVRYIQDMLYIERQYKYLVKLEKRISISNSIRIFGREGSNYLNGYPIVLNLIDLFYKMLIPILFAVINTVRIYKEWAMVDKINVALICDVVLFISIFTINWFYFFEIHTKIADFCKRYIPFVNSISKFLRKILKEV